MAGTVQRTMDKAKAFESSTLAEYVAAGGYPDSSKNQDITQQLVHREVVYCVSSLVYHFAQNPAALDGSDYHWEDDVLPLCTQRPDHAEEIEEIETAISETESAIADKEADIDDATEELRAREQEERAQYTDTERGAARAHRESLRGELADLQSALTLLETKKDELEQDEDEREAYEHWIISDWFAAQLKAKGEMTGELFGLTIYGRTCTGQAIALDSVTQEIAAEMQILEGQRNDWSK